MSQRTSGRTREEQIACLEEIMPISATGTQLSHLQEHYVDQVARVFGLYDDLSEEERTRRSIVLHEMMAEFKPTDGVEGALVAQMVATQRTAMECLARAVLPNQTFEGTELYLKFSGKFQDIFIRQLAALDKPRGKGQQQVTVKHVHVGDGGQAIVGNVHGGEPTNGAPESEVRPTPAIDHNPGETLNDNEASEEDGTSPEPARRQRAKRQTR